MINKATDLEGYALKCLDGEVGAVHEMYFDDRHWTIRYLIVDTGPWLGRQVLISPSWIEHVGWDESKVVVNLSRDAVKAAPAYRQEFFPARDYEIRLHQHYGRLGYWIG